MRPRLSIRNLMALVALAGVDLAFLTRGMAIGDRLGGAWSALAFFGLPLIVPNLIALEFLRGATLGWRLDPRMLGLGLVLLTLPLLASCFL